MIEPKRIGELDISFMKCPGGKYIDAIWVRTSGERLLNLGEIKELHSFLGDVIDEISCDRRPQTR